MQPSIEGSVEQSPLTQPRHHLGYLEQNNIRAEGCSHLSKAQWTKLQTLDLGISWVIQGITISELKDAAIYRRLSGPNSTYSTYVSVALFREQQYRSLGMPEFIEGSMDQPPRNQPRYQHGYLAENNIDKDGFAYVKNMC